MPDEPVRPAKAADWTTADLIMEYGRCWTAFWDSAHEGQSDRRGRIWGRVITCSHELAQRRANGDTLAALPD